MQSMIHTRIRYDSSKFANAEIEVRGADNETKIAVTRIRGSETYEPTNDSTVFYGK